MTSSSPFNALHPTRDLLESLARWTALPHRIFLLDNASIARAILTVRRDGALRERMSREGLKTAQGFDHREEARRHLALYRELFAR